MSVAAAIRPDSGNFPLFLHVLGAMIFVGGLLTCVGMFALARGGARVLRLGYWSLVAVAVPGYLLMRVGAEWIYSKEGWDDVVNEPDWIGLGYLIADTGALVLLVALLAGGVGVYRQRKGKGSVLLGITLALSVVLLTAYVVAVWAMSGKPG